MNKKTAMKWGAFAVAIAAAGLIGAAPPANGPTKIEKSFGGWTVTCIENNGTKQCAMAQTLVAGQNKRPIFIWVIGSTPTKQLINKLTVPSEVSIKEGIRVSIGGKPQTTVPYDVCASGVCVGTFPLDAATLQTMSTSQDATVIFVLASRKLAQMKMDFKNFPAAYEYFKSQL